MTPAALLAALVLAAAAESPVPDPDRAAFERWVQPDSVEALEVLLAAPSSRHPASLWGHLLLRVRYREDVPSPPGFAPVFQIGVEDAAPGEELAHTVAGVFGGLEAKLFVTPSHRVERRYRTVEGRGLKVFALELDAGERRRVLERLWIASRDRHRWRYAFFTDNCAGLLVELVGPALEPELALGSAHFIRWPSSSLDLLARARRLDGRPLLRYVGEEPGSVDRAVEAARARDPVEERLRRAGAPLDGIGAGDPPARAAADAALGEWGERTPGAAEDVSAFLSGSIDVELGEPRRRATSATRRAMVAALGDALAPLPPPEPRAPDLRRSGVAVGASGAYSASFAGGLVRDERGAARPAIEVDAAIVEERPGEVRERGFRPDLGLRLLGARARFERERDGRAVLTRHEWTVAALDSERRGSGPSAALHGWGDPRRGVDASGFVELGRAVGIASGDEASRLSVRAAAAGGMVRRAEDGTVAPAAAVRGRIGLRLRAGRTSLDRVELAVEPQALAIDGESGWIAHAGIGVARAIGDRDRPSVIRLSMLAGWGPGLRAKASSSPELGALVEWHLP